MNIKGWCHNPNCKKYASLVRGPDGHYYCSECDYKLRERLDRGFI